MEPETEPTTQLALFDYGGVVTSEADLLPVIWRATESMVSPDPLMRQRGIDLILELGAQRTSPTVAFILATCLADGDIYLRRRTAFILADLITTSKDNRQVTEEARQTVLHYLHNMNAAIAFGLVEVAVADPNAEKVLYHLFNACPYAGKYLSEILAEWKNPLAIRQQAIHLIGLVGYLEALPVLERILSRLEARQSGQFVMPFAPPSIKSDEDILPYLRVAINQLTTH